MMKSVLQKTNFRFTKKLQYFPEIFFEIVNIVKRFQKINFYKVIHLKNDSMLNVTNYDNYSKIFNLYSFVFFNYTLLDSFIRKCLFFQNKHERKKKIFKNFFFSFILKKFSFDRFYKKLIFTKNRLFFF